MSELECIICCHPFNSGINLPRVLQCGHTICTLCLGNILESSKACPSCRKTTIKDNVNDYCINYTVLKICESKVELNQHRTKENFIQLFQEKLQKRIEEHRELRISLESLKDETDLNIGLIRSNEQQLASLSDECDPFNRDTRRKLKEIDKNFNITCGTLHNLSVLSVSHLFSDISFKADMFNSFEEFLQAIHDETMLKNKIVVAVLRIKGVKHFAKLSIRDDILFIHSFEQNQEKDHDVTTVCFQDLQDILLRSDKAKSIFGFLDLSYRENKFSRRVLIEMTDNFPMPPSIFLRWTQFLKICTGERGISYKGREYQQSYGRKVRYANEPNEEFLTDTIIHIKNVNWNIKEDNYSTYFSNQCLDICSDTCCDGLCYISLEENGELEIFRTTDCDSTYNNIIGTVMDSNKDLYSTFEDASVRKVLDSGIAVKL